MLEIKPDNPDAPAHDSPQSHTPPKSKGSTGDHPVASNYQYWREHGGSWADEYDTRKRGQPYYHIQELMLTDYISRCAPAKVLEFGCGPGRHLRNLTKLPGIDAYGYDQSVAMVSGCRRWASAEWVSEHISVGLPTARLPYDDREFDVVYTAEVLLHVRPEDLLGRLEELLRIARGHIVHLETSPTYPLVDSDHDGCWHHDLVGAYAKLGHVCDVLPSGYICHTPFRVALAEKGPEPAWSPVLLSMYRRMERDLVAGINDKDAHAAALTQARDAALAERDQAAESVRVRVAQLELDLERRSIALREAEARLADLAARPTHDQLAALKIALDDAHRQLADAAAELDALRADSRAAQLESQLSETRAAAARDAEERALRLAAWRKEAAKLAEQRDRAQQRANALLQANDRLVARLHAALRGGSLP
jgi:SAM-dependent methyltransferase